MRRGPHTAVHDASAHPVPPPPTAAVPSHPFTTRVSVLSEGDDFFDARSDGGATDASGDVSPTRCAHAAPSTPPADAPSGVLAYASARIGRLWSLVGGGGSSDAEAAAPPAAQRALSPSVRHSFLRRASAAAPPDDPPPVRRVTAPDGTPALELAPGVVVPEADVLEPEPPPPGAGGCLPLLAHALARDSAFPGPRFALVTAHPDAGASGLARATGAPKEAEAWAPAQGDDGKNDPAAAALPLPRPPFLVRSLDYLRTRVKEPSPPPLYELVGVDVYSFDFKINHIARHVALPPAPPPHASVAALPPHDALPPRIVINIQLPTYPPSLFGGATDGPGHSLVFYFALPARWDPETHPCPAALGLLRRFVHNGREDDGTPTRDRLKLIARIANPEEWVEDARLSTPEARLLQNYNDKPLLTRPQHKFYHGDGYLEIDLNVHGYAFLARKALSTFMGRLGSVVFENAFVVEGRSQGELPECVFAAARVYRMDFGKARPFPADVGAVSARRTASVETASGLVGGGEDQ